MPKQTAIINYQICEPTLCKGGICQAVQACPRKLLKQEEPYEMPDSGMGVGLNDVPRGSLGHWVQIENKKIKKEKYFILIGFEQIY